MKSLLSYFSLKNRLPYQINRESNRLPNEDPSRPHSSESILKPGELGIIIPQPQKPTAENWPYWISSINEPTGLLKTVSGFRTSSSESINKSEIETVPTLTKEERFLKVQKFLEKRKRKNSTKKIRYQYRQQLAEKRIRYQGRFVKAEDARKLILDGQQVTAKDKTELNKLLDDDAEKVLLAKYTSNLKLRKRIFKTEHDNSVVNNLFGGERKFSSNSSGSSSGMNLLANTIQEFNLNNTTNEIKAQVKTSSIIKL